MTCLEVLKGSPQVDPISSKWDPLPNVSPCRILVCLLFPSQLQAPIDASLCYIVTLVVYKLTTPSPVLSDHIAFTNSEFEGSGTYVGTVVLNHRLCCNNSARLGNSAVNEVERNANSAKLTSYPLLSHSKYNLS